MRCFRDATYDCRKKKFNSSFRCKYKQLYDSIALRINQLKRQSITQSQIMVEQIEQFMEVQYCGAVGHSFRHRDVLFSRTRE